MPSPAWALVAFVAWYAALVVGWRVLLRRWGLAGPGAPAREALDREEHVARRSLRALLAFDALVLLPVGIPMLVAAAFAATLDVDALEILGGTLLGLVVFLLPVLPMLRRVRLLEAHRLAGLPPPPPPSPPTSGSPTLDAASAQASDAFQQDFVQILKGIFNRAQIALETEIATYTDIEDRPDLDGLAADRLGSES